MHSIATLFAFVVQAHAAAFVARRLFDNSAERQRGESWKQTGREEKEDGTTGSRSHPAVLTRQIKQLFISI